MSSLKMFLPEGKKFNVLKLNISVYSNLVILVDL